MTERIMAALAFLEADIVPLFLLFSFYGSGQQTPGEANRIFRHVNRRSTQFDCDFLPLIFSIFLYLKTQSCRIVVRL